jgi:hypothetical protein
MLFDGCRLGPSSRNKKKMGLLATETHFVTHTSTIVCEERGSEVERGNDTTAAGRSFAQAK